MTDTFDGFAFGFTSSDVNAPGGKRSRQLLVVAPDLEAATAIAHHYMPSATFEESGADVLATARSIGVADNDAKVYDPNT